MSLLFHLSKDDPTSESTASQRLTARTAMGPSPRKVRIHLHIYHLGHPPSNNPGLLASRVRQPTLSDPRVTGPVFPLMLLFRLAKVSGSVNHLKRIVVGDLSPSCRPLHLEQWKSHVCHGLYLKISSIHLYV